MSAIDSALDGFLGVQAQADAVLADPLYWFPVRHHSPAVARHLREALRARRPKVVFIEGPPDCSGLVEHIVSSKTKPPVALYVSYQDDDDVLGLRGIASAAPDIPARFTSWYPLLPYSPEYVALCVAHEIGADVVFMDLPHYARPMAAPAEEPEGEEPDEHAALEEGVPDPAALVERTMEVSSFYQGLTEAAGYKSFDETWDSLFELPGPDRYPDVEAFRRDLAYFCAAARATTDPARIATDGTLERERFMWKTIRTELDSRKLRPEQAMVVCGGFHLFLAREDEEPPEVPRGTVYATVAPYSYFRTSELSGYGAGNRAPRYYQRLWDCLEARGTPDDAMVEQVCASLAVGRKAGEALSSADAVSIAQIARGLAGLRGRRWPSLDDIQDAIVTCCVKGKPEQEGKHLLKALQDAAVGNAVGKVTSALGQLPLVHDFHTQLSELDLGEVMGRDKRIDLQLDRRDPLGGRRSAFLHRLVQVGIPFAKLKKGPKATGTLFKEQWEATWAPKVEQALIEHNLYGDTVEAAATARLEEEIAQEAGHASAVTARWRKAVDMDLPALVMRLESACGQAIDEDRRLPSLAQALVDLAVLEQHASFRGWRKDLIHDLGLRAFGRACFALPDVANVPDEDQPEIVTSLAQLAEALLSSKGELDQVLFASNVRTAADLSESPMLRGVFLGILAEIREMPTEELAAHVAAYARSLPEERLNAGAFLEGIFAVSRTSILLGADALVAAIDELLRSSDWDVFVSMLPRLRHAFERLHERQRHSFADRVGARYGLGDGDKLVKLNTSVDAAVALAEIDARVAAILADWWGT
jgi:hypothetical protein